MVSYRYLIILVSAFLTSCAQVGTISGGDKDITAPRPVVEKISPQNGTTNFNQKSVEIPFDEYFRLNNPSQTIKLVPPHATINAEVKGKSLLLNWEEDLEENTTYAIYLNSSLKDITEGNDSIIQYVFSTGPIIDTLSYRGSIIDAWTHKPIKGSTVALYEQETNELVSFCESDVNGQFTLNYLHSGNYRLLAFEDDNGDLIHQKHERTGFPINSQISISEPFLDTLPILLYTPTGDPAISLVKYWAPGSIVLTANQPLTEADIKANGTSVSKDKIHFLKEDSVLVFVNTTDVQSIDLVVHSAELQDSASVRFTKEDKSSAIRINCSSANNTFAPSEKISFSINDYITKIDTSKINVFNVSDSLTVDLYSYSIEQNRLIFELEKDSISQYSITFNNGAITTTHGTTDEQSYIVRLNSVEKYGRVNLDLSYYRSPIVLHIIKNNKPYRVLPITSPGKKILAELLPGEYTFKAVLDLNGNKKWDVGNKEQNLQPELIDSYSEAVKVRANWEIEVSLIPSK